MLESLDNAKEELKRADHLFYVSLKYTRTVDIIKSIIERLINACSFTVEALLLKAKADGRVEGIPQFPLPKIKLAKELFPNDDIVLRGLDFFSFLRKLDKAPFTRSNEFRRHVTMTATIEGLEVPVKIDDIKEYFDLVKNFVAHAGKLINGEEDDD